MSAQSASAVTGPHMMNMTATSTPRCTGMSGHGFYVAEPFRFSAVTVYSPAALAVASPESAKLP